MYSRCHHSMHAQYLKFTYVYRAVRAYVRSSSWTGLDRAAAAPRARPYRIRGRIARATVLEVTSEVTELRRKTTRCPLVASIRGCAASLSLAIPMQPAGARARRRRLAFCAAALRAAPLAAQSSERSPPLAPAVVVRVPEGAPLKEPVRLRGCCSFMIDASDSAWPSELATGDQFIPIHPNSSQFIPIHPNSSQFIPIHPNSSQFIPIRRPGPPADVGNRRVGDWSAAKRCQSDCVGHSMPRCD
eukprot:SAG31_NODE_6760_length_1895_cov_2.774499_2_plen_244_part_00